MSSNESRPAGKNVLFHILREFAGRFSFRRESLPIDNLDLLEEFVSSRAAFVAQKTLYGYLKTRMGTRYPSMFEDDVFVHSINIAKLQVFAACLSDLTIFAVGHGFRHSSLEPDALREIAQGIFERSLSENSTEAPAEFSQDEALSRFIDRLAETDWAADALDRGSFSGSAEALIHWAPIAPTLKAQDTDIVRNSINFTWSEVRQNFLRRLSTAGVSDSYTSSAQR